MTVASRETVRSFSILAVGSLPRPEWLLPFPVAPQSFSILAVGSLPRPLQRLAQIVGIGRFSILAVGSLPRPNVVLTGADLRMLFQYPRCWIVA